VTEILDIYQTGFNPTAAIVTVNVTVKPTRGLLEIRRADDVVAIEHGARLVAGHLHRHALRHARVDGIPDGGAPQIVAEAARDAGRLARGRPCLAKSSRRCPARLRP